MTAKASLPTSVATAAAAVAVAGFEELIATSILEVAVGVSLLPLGRSSSSLSSRSSCSWRHCITHLFCGAGEVTVATVRAVAQQGEQ
jgi:hypothetical protein